jgi:hypothetical protein
MPDLQVASVDVFDFGAAGTGNPAAGNAATVLLFEVKRAGKVQFTFSNPDDSVLTVTVQTASALTASAGEFTLFADIAAATHLSLIANIAVPAKTNSAPYDVLLREGLDKYVRVLATGRVRGQLQVRPGNSLSLITDVARLVTLKSAATIYT